MSPRLLLCLPLLLVMLSTASADEPAAGTEPIAGRFGTIELLRDRTGGALTVVRRASREVEIVRNGGTFAATPDLALHPADAVRAATGVAAIALPDGGRVEIGERSQVRIDAGMLTQRLGDVFVDTTAPLAVLVGEARIEIVGAARITSTLQLTGLVQVLRGEARVISADSERIVGPAQATEVGTPNIDVRALTETDVAAVLAGREAFVVPEATPLAESDKAHVLVQGGIGHLDRQDFVQVDLSARIHLGGPAWVSFGAALLARPAEEVAGWSTVLAVPVRLGVRFIAPLPRSVFLFGGADLSLLLGERCTSLDGCPRAFSVEPGGVVELGAGINVHPRLGLQFSVGGGLYRRRLPPPSPGLADVAFPEFQFHALVGLFVRI